MTETRQCTHCGKAFATVTSKCPFCGTARDPTPAGGGRPTFDFAAFADQAIEQQRPILDLEYHPAAILAVEALLDQAFGPDGAAPNDEPWKPPERTLRSLAMLGAFVGEVLRRAWGGAWQLHPEQPAQIMVAGLVFPAGAQVHPLSQVYHCAKSGAKQSLFGWYQQLRTTLSTGEGDADGWVRYGERFAQVGRLDWAARFFAVASTVSGDHAWNARALELREASRRKVAAAAKLEQTQATLDAWGNEGEKWLIDRGARTDTGCMTLTAVDFLIRDLCGSKPVPVAAVQLHQAVIHALGAFVGRVLCRRFNARWLPDPERAPDKWQVGWDGGERASPFAMIAARIEHGSDRLVLEQVATAIKDPCARGACVDPPEDPVAWTEQARRFAQSQQMPWALEFGRMALEYGGDTLELQIDLADWLCRLRRFKEAAEHVRTALDQDDRSYRAWEVRATVMAGLGEDAQAKQAAEFARKLRERPWESPWAQSQPSLDAMLSEVAQASDPGAALVLYGKINAAYPDYAEAWRERGVALSLLGRSEPALQCFERGIALEPREPKSHDHKAVLLGRLERWDEALQAIDAGLALCPGARVLLQRKGIYLSKLGRKTEAIAQFNAALELFPGDEHTLRLRAEAAAS